MAALAEAQTGADEDQIEGTQSGPDADKGQLFEVPRIAIVVDESDPTVLKLAFSGSVELDRANDAELFNKLTAGKNATLNVDVFVKSGPANTHRRDSEGNVDAVVAQKSLLVHSITIDE